MVYPAGNILKLQCTANTRLQSAIQVVFYESEGENFRGFFTVSCVNSSYVAAANLLIHAQKHTTVDVHLRNMEPESACFPCIWLKTFSYKHNQPEALKAET